MGQLVVFVNEQEPGACTAKASKQSGELAGLGSAALTVGDIYIKGILSRHASVAPPSHAGLFDCGGASVLQRFLTIICTAWSRTSGQTTTERAAMYMDLL